MCRKCFEKGYKREGAKVARVGVARENKSSSSSFDNSYSTAEPLEIERRFLKL